MKSLEDPYEALAAEYYVPELHPTCANLGQASYVCLVDWLETHSLSGVAVDIGCGDSSLARAIFAMNFEPISLTLVDSSPAMLAHSRHWEAAGVQLVIGSADRLPCADGSVNFLCAALGDPYNRPQFWGEVARILAIGGRAFFTTPAWEWVNAYRPQEGAPPDAARFLVGGAVVDTPSYVLRPDAQVALMRSVGLDPEASGSVSVDELGPGPISPKLEVARSNCGRIVDWYVARRG